MDGISVPSRFACLKIEDEEFHPVSHKSAKKRVDNSGRVDNRKIVQDKGVVKKPARQVRN